ncbi:alpha/beta-hydrolase [Nadsonia fulvescens var. elongata DSM 6958]|uniref:Alpha/beta-hydrolase n=1 Tax=Nadsonia fulvescens var. elongata DSM 6958 TaxID=857566 RepID=A0A1E3PFK9_9ASCO|nr:alpha/beta-hydrolase [Nadsonia fulvescens var. elongata DSM 6958]
MWEWDIIDMGTKDLPCMIDFILAKTINEKLALVAHSQGTTQTFIALAKSQRPDIGRKISCVCALAPAIYGGSLLDKPYWRFVQSLPRRLYTACFGLHAFMPVILKMHSLMKERFYGFFGYLMFHFLFDWKDNLWDHNIRSRHLIFSPVYVSSELMRWWLGKGGFSRRRCIFDEVSDDYKAWYDSKFPPLAIFIPHNDCLTDGLKLLYRIEKYEPDVQLVAAIHLPEYSHLDVLWAMDVNDRVSVHIKRVIWETAYNKEEKICPLF